MLTRKGTYDMKCYYVIQVHRIVLIGKPRICFQETGFSAPMSEFAVMLNTVF